jgi:hypothetical protein
LLETMEYTCRSCDNIEIVSVTGHEYDHRCSNCEFRVHPYNTTFFYLSMCSYCKNLTNVRILQSSGNMNVPTGCLHCKEFNYCANAKSDVDICNYNYKCYMCNEMTCIHGLSSESPTLCIDCKETFIIGKKIIKMISGNKIKTFHSLLKELRL